MIKAGGAGSNPDSITKFGDNSLPLTIFLRSAGEIVAVLNTAVVGLDAVANGYQKPDRLNISWDPADRTAAAGKARKFIVESAIVRLSEAIEEHALSVAKLSRFESVCKEWDGKTKKADKILGVYKFCLGEDYLVAASLLVVHWRNRIIHPSSGAGLRLKEKSWMEDAEESIREKYDGLNLYKTFGHFEDQKPTLKDVSSLSSMCVNLVRKIDKNLSESFSKEDLDVWLSYLNITPNIDRIRRETRPEKVDESLRRLVKSKAPVLLPAFERYYVSV